MLEHLLQIPLQTILESVIQGSASPISSDGVRSPDNSFLYSPNGLNVLNPQ